MKYHSRRLIKYEDLNPRGTLFGGQLLKWIDEEVAICAINQLETTNIVTKFISSVDFISPANLNDIIEIGTEVISFGTTSIILSANVRNRTTGNDILFIEKIVFVCVDDNGVPKPHNKKLN